MPLRHTFQPITNKTDDVGQSHHPHPFRLVLVPDQQFIHSFIDEDVDGGDQVDGFVYGAHSRVDRHAVVGGARNENVCDEILEGELYLLNFTALLVVLLF